MLEITSFQVPRNIIIVTFYYSRILKSNWLLLTFNPEFPALVGNWLVIKSMVSDTVTRRALQMVTHCHKHRINETNIALVVVCSWVLQWEVQRWHWGSAQATRSHRPGGQTLAFQPQMLRTTADFAQNISNLSFIVIAKYKLPENPPNCYLYFKYLVFSVWEPKTWQVSGCSVQCAGAMSCSRHLRQSWQRPLVTSVCTMSDAHIAHGLTYLNHLHSASNYWALVTLWRRPGRGQEQVWGHTNTCTFIGR